MGLEDYFSSYFIAFAIIVGLYMLTIQGPDLIKIEHLNREGRFARRTGIVYIVIGVICIILRLF